MSHDGLLKCEYHSAQLRAVVLAGTRRILQQAQAQDQDEDCHDECSSQIIQSPCTTSCRYQADRESGDGSRNGEHRGMRRKVRHLRKPGEVVPSLAVADLLESVTASVRSCFHIYDTLQPDSTTFHFLASSSLNNVFRTCIPSIVSINTKLFACHPQAHAVNIMSLSTSRQ